MKFLHTFAAAWLAVQYSTAIAIGGKPGFLIRGPVEPEKRAALQSIVTWDKHSLSVNGERIMIYSGEFHPFRLPVPSLWLDVFQKIKAMGFNCVSFYVDWALLEGKQGDFTAEGVFAFEPFFQAATNAGIYLIARPGPYINAEASGGGFPGWLARIKGILRTSASDYLAATDNYVASIGAIIAKAQITKGGPVILWQPENEYSSFGTGQTENPAYMQYVENQARNAGIVVPFISNDAGPDGHNVPGSGTGAVDIYGHDGYPLGFNCAAPSTWNAGRLPTNYRAKHLSQSPNTPYSIDEFQGGSFDPWGGHGFENCAELLNMEFERVFYKNNYAAGVTIFSIYMIYGGTNWGNLGHPGGYTSYDYGSAITENRLITREKYSEAKLEAQFLKVSPAYLTATAGTNDSTTYTSTSDLTVTPVVGNGTKTSFFVLRHVAYQNTASTKYTLKLPTSSGTLAIPALGGSLTLNGRDSKIHVTDYDVGGTTLLYSTAEVFTWKKFTSSTVLILYGGPGELHETAIKSTSTPVTIEGSGVTTKSASGTVTLQWTTSATRRIVQLGTVYIYLLDRNSAYNYWVPDLPGSGSTPAYGTSAQSPESVIVKAGYLIRNVTTSSNGLYLNGDFNATTPIEVIGAASGLTALYVNGKSLSFTTNKYGVWSSSIAYASPSLGLPSLSSLTWSYIDALPEIQTSYSDKSWTSADHTTTNNSLRALTTPTSLYSSDYGYHTGYLLYRGQFTATGAEKTFTIETQGGAAFGSSVWVGDSYLGSWTGSTAEGRNNTYTMPKLTVGTVYVFTVLIDNNGLDENWTIGLQQMKTPRGILNYALDGHSASSIKWKLTGNLGGETYADRTRGPLNEGGLYPERQGWHQPSPPSSKWATGKPTDGITAPGVRFYTTTFDLAIPTGYDVPLSFIFSDSTSPAADYRVQLYVNGYQFGKYTNNIGPQKSFPVPEGILNYRGTNTLAVTLWAQQAGGAKVGGLALAADTPVLSGLGTVSLVAMPGYTSRAGAY